MRGWRSCSAGSRRNGKSRCRAERPSPRRSGAAAIAITEVPVGRDLAARLARLRPAVAFNALHGRYGEDGAVQGLLEVMAIPYTGPGILTSALAMDKTMAKTVWRSLGLPTPRWTVVDPAARRMAKLPAPLPAR